ncbi:hypothetical protein RFI_14618, partial [Reticulomyxa filosa]
MAKFDRSRLAMFENLGKKNEEKPQAQSPVPPSSGGKFNSDRLAFVQKLQSQQSPTTRSGPSNSVSKTEASDGSFHKEDEDMAKEGSEHKNSVTAEKEAPPADPSAEPNKEKDNETGKENGPICF